MAERFYYFAYGSNMSLRRLQTRTPSAARVEAPLILSCHALRFHKIGRDGSGKCDIVPVNDPGAVVCGVLFSILRAEKPALDAAEGLGVGYAEHVLTFTLSNGNEQVATSYRALQVDPSLRPFDWYKHHVLTGAREAAAPDHYLDQLAATESVSDPDRERAARELQIYR